MSNDWRPLLSRLATAGQEVQEMLRRRRAVPRPFARLRRADGAVVGIRADRDHPELFDAASALVDFGDEVGERQPASGRR